MTFAARLYPDLVTDLLTTLTGGTVREGIVAPTDPALPMRLPLLANRPVRRISSVQGVTVVGRGATAQDVAVVFTDADYELVSAAGTADLDSLRFRPKGRQPKPGSTLVINYYPASTPPTPVTDLNVGSVVRTLVETVGLELALAYQQLDLVYRSAFVGTASGGSLDEVVELVGVTRTPGGAPAVTLTFTRAAGAGASARLTVPAGTVVTDVKGNRYLTADDLDLEPGETNRTVTAFGESAATPVAAAGALTRLEVAISGIASVGNDKPAFVLDSPESDDDLRRRARRALHGAVRGTLDALVSAVEGVTGVRRVSATEPVDQPGVLKLDIAYGDDSAAVQQAVAATIAAFRPAGIRVQAGPAASVALTVTVAITWAGATTPTAAALTTVRGTVGDALTSYVQSIPPGGQIRRARLSALVMQDPRVADANVTLSWSGGSGEEFSLPDGQVATVDHVVFAPDAVEAPSVTAGGSSTVDFSLPVVPVASATVDAATAAIRTALTSYLGSRGATAPLDVASMANAIRTDAVFTLVRASVTVTVRSGGQFQQLSDQLGSYTPQPGERLVLGQLDVTAASGAS
jgi:uncharacterized phage protein gp47/JayE